MSRMHDILKKAEREGTVRRTHAVPAPAPTPYATPVRAAVADPPPPLDAPAVARSDQRPRRTIEAGHLSPLLVAALTPHSAPAEQYRTLRTRLALGEDGQPRRVLLVTSPARGDGKSVTASNLALTMAQEFNRRVVLVDADLREPTVHALFGLPRTPGLTDVLGGLDLEEALVELPELNLTVLPAGTPAARPAEQLGSAAMRRCLDTLRIRFDRVLLDVPPTLPLADVGAVAPQADGALLVVRAGLTTKPEIERALAAFDAGRLLGLVLNGTENWRPAPPYTGPASA